NISFDKDYDLLKSVRAGPKTKLLSVISSDKAFTEEHKKRLEFVGSLKDIFGDEIDFFGRGKEPIEDKWDAIAPYKYHVVLENGEYRDYWTEKIADCYLAWTYPFYAGCPNLGKYFPPESFTPLSYGSAARAAEAIRAAIDRHRYETALPQ